MKESINLVFNYLNELGEKISPFAEQIYGIYRKQVIAEGVTSAVMIGASIIAIIIFVFIIKALLKKESHDDFDDGMIILSCFAIIILTAIIIFSAPLSIKKLLNPDYYAIQKLLQIIK